jgi:hypothetical protein
MRSKVAAVTAASLLGGLGVAVVSSGAGSAAPPATSTESPVVALAKSSADLNLDAAGTQHVAALQTTSNTNLGAVTFVDDYLAGPASLDVTLTQGSTQIGELPLAAGAYTSPQLLPAGTYTVTLADATDTAQTATETLTVTAGTDTSEVFSAGVVISSTTTPSSSTSTSTTVPVTPLAVVATTYTDAVGTVPNGQAVISLRDLSSVGPVDVYVNGTKVATNITGPANTDVTVSPGVEKVIVVPTGTAPTSTPLYSGSFTAEQDSYVPLYLIDAPSSTIGLSAETTPFLQGYQYTASDGGLFNYGSYPFLGSTGNIKLNQPMVGGAEATNGSGYWLVASDGGIFTFGNNPFLGSLGNLTLNSPIVGIAATTGPNGQPGYLLVGKDGGVFAFNASYYGSLGGQVVSSPVVGIAADPSTGGYTIAEANGSWFTYGPTHVNNPVTGQVAASLNAPIVGLADTPDGGGTWLVASDGGVFSIGNAPFEGSAGNIKLNQPITSIVPAYDGLGYQLIAADGGVFCYGSAKFFGSTGNIVLNKPIVGAVNS